MQWCPKKRQLSNIAGPLIGSSTSLGSHMRPLCPSAGSLRCRRDAKVGRVFPGKNASFERLVERKKHIVEKHLCHGIPSCPMFCCSAARSTTLVCPKRWARKRCRGESVRDKQSEQLLSHEPWVESLACGASIVMGQLRVRELSMCGAMGCTPLLPTNCQTKFSHAKVCVLDFESSLFVYCGKKADPIEKELATLLADLWNFLGDGALRKTIRCVRYRSASTKLWSNTIMDTVPERGLVASASPETSGCLHGTFSKCSTVSRREIVQPFFPFRCPQSPPKQRSSCPWLVLTKNQSAQS